MPHITCTLDPISMKDVHDLKHHPSIHEGVGEDQLTVYFEDEKNRAAYLATPTEHPCGDVGVDRSNTTREWIDNG
ncbi:MAG: hypothetical protein GW783_10895 [Deltaproteobacteria bacterium]|nr:hypothetical protein [Deltaproteobacteria bacterium]OIP67609.1 MAG: hypothetical protein AUK30_00480 [Nitrospirae bacterium CG2_30_70_394]PIU79910.1 MAG: hypothetical protein COS73_02035 [Nitrospirae bacterium CG06_land_8_20_14_3_00_70_43]PIW82062.1 MAG: hypothetical protein COZ96_10675 [Nitrospirae bacterium CG_4_8_14_3_um_filter_70_85]PIX83938.1 MAG: hypothetical protein COZ33_02810 [Nitrospirae bacterium CG_4_10_14_3_um_filter_70_108]PJB95870.1 MAG: hypothetical protein CO080_05455 [Nitr